MKNCVKMVGRFYFVLILAFTGSFVSAQEQFSSAPLPPTGGYYGTDHPAAQSSYAPAGTQYPSTQQRPTAPYPPSNVYPATGQYSQAIAPYPQSDQVEATRYIQPSTSTTSALPPLSGTQPPFLQPASNAPSLTPYNDASRNSANSTNEGDSSNVNGSVEGKTVADVRIVGNLKIQKERIVSMIHTRKGREFSSETVQRDVREMSRSGLFVNVKPSYLTTADGVVVIFEVIERPLLDSVKFVGAKAIKRKTLLKESGLKEGDPADPFKVEEARRSLEYFYHDKGFAQARITIHTGNKPGDREVIFLINEGSKQKVLWTNFEGNSVASDARLKTQIESKEGILWFINGEFNREKVEADKEKLLAYYRGLGFFQATVGADVSFTFDHWAMVTFVINEGPRYKVRDTRFIGNDIYREGQLQDELKLLSGEYFNQSKMNSDMRAIQEKYGRVGHVFADVKAEPRFLEEPGMLDLVYNIKEGDQYRVSRVITKIKGEGETSRTKNTVILDRLSLAPGDIIDTQKIRESERRLGASGVFATNPANGGSVPKILISPPDELDESRDPRGSYGGDPDDAQTRGQNW